MDLREAIIDETRWPKMFHTLQSAGLFSSCGCSGCGDCQAAARRFMRGITRHAQYAGPHQRFRFGDRYPVLTRSLGGQRIELLVDSAHAPSIVGLRIEREQQEGEWERMVGASPCTGLTWKQIFGTITPQDGLPATAIPANARVAAIAASALGLAATCWQGPTFWTQMTNRSKPGFFIDPNAKGLYVIRWPDGHGTGSTPPQCGAYLGAAGAKGKGLTIVKRLSHHYTGWRRFRLRNLPNCPGVTNYAIYWRPIEDVGKIGPAETQTLRAIRSLSSAGLPEAAQYRQQGFGNAAELESDLGYM